MQGIHVARRRGFTLMELMIVVAILGILMAIAIPAFSSFIARSKTAEVPMNLNNLFKAASSYYTSDRGKIGVAAQVSGHCTVGNTDPSPGAPTKAKVPFVATPNFKALGFTISDFVYFSYGITSTDNNSICAHDPKTPLYTFYAEGDLDGDSNYSRFALAVGSDDSNVLYHARGMYVVNETE